MVKKPERYSFSKLNSFDMCPLSWYKNYVLHEEKADNAFALYGTLIHSLMERYEKGELELSALTPTFEWEYETALNGVKFPPNKWTDLGNSYYNSGLEFLSTYEGLEGKTILGVEQTFDIPIDDWIFTGVIDLAFRDEENKLVIRDWKSSKRWTGDALTEHARQPYLYSLWVKQQYGQYPDVLQFYHFREGKTADIPFREADLAEAIDWARKSVDKIRTAWVWEATPPSEFWCQNICSTRLNCEYAKPKRRKK